MKLAGMCLLLILPLMAVSAGQKKQADHCTPDGGNGSVRCGGESAAACIQLHPDNDEGTGVCQTEETLPNCCAASPYSGDRTATACQCCKSGKQSMVLTPEVLASLGYDN